MMLPSRTVGSNGGEVQGSRGSGGLDVVVTIDQDGRLIGEPRSLGEDQRVPLRLDQLDRRQAHRAEVVDEELGGPAGVGVVVGLGADAGDPEEGLELLLEVAPVGIQIGVHPLDRHRPTCPSHRVPRRSRGADFRTYGSTQYIRDREGEATGDAGEPGRRLDLPMLPGRSTREFSRTAGLREAMEQVYNGAGFLKK